MEYPDVRWVLQPELYPHHIAAETLPYLSLEEDYVLLEHLLGLSREGLLSLTLHRFASRFTPPISQRPLNPPSENVGKSAPFLLVHRALFSLVPQTVRICPYCVDGPDGYDRLFWRITPILFCPRHQVLLIGSCPACRAPIPALRLHPNTCPSCGKSYSDQMLALPQEEVSWPLSSHHLLFDHLGIPLAEHGMSAPFPEKSPLTTISSSVYFELLEHLDYLLTSQDIGKYLTPFLLRTHCFEERALSWRSSSLFFTMYLLDGP